jgi:hypothetical protein
MALGERRREERNRAAGNPKRRIAMTTVNRWAESEWRNKYMYNSHREHRSEFAIMYSTCNSLLRCILLYPI